MTGGQAGLQGRREGQWPPHPRAQSCEGFPKLQPQAAWWPLSTLAPTSPAPSAQLPDSAQAQSGPEAWPSLSH